MAQAFADYRQTPLRSLPKHPYQQLVYPQPGPYFLPTAPSDFALTLPPLVMNWPSQYSPSTSWEGFPPPQHRYLPSPAPSNISPSLSPQSVGCLLDGSRRLTPQRRPPSASSTSTSWAPPRPHVLTPAPSIPDSPPILDYPLGPSLTRVGSRQFHEQASFYIPYHANPNTLDSSQPPPAQRVLLPPHDLHRPTPAFQSTALTFSPDPIGSHHSVIPIAGLPPVHHFLCLPPSDACHAPHGSRYPCETRKWLDLVGRLPRLSREVFVRICGYVDYERLIFLRQLNRFMRDNVDTQVAHYESKVAFVIFAEARFPQHAPGTAFNAKNNPDNGDQGTPRAEHTNAGGPQGKRLKQGAGQKRGAGQKQAAGQKLDTGQPQDTEGSSADTTDGNSRLHIPGNFGCYLECFKVLGPENFEIPQWSSQERDDSPPPENPGFSTLGEPPDSRYLFPPKSSTGLLAPIRQAGRPNVPAIRNPGPAKREPRRYCIKCGIKHGYYKPGKYILRRVGEKVWVCKCRRTHEYGTLTCRDCGSYCPFSPSDR